jgi:hypothetical protein
VKEVGDSRGRATVSGLREADSNRLEWQSGKKAKLKKGYCKAERTCDQAKRRSIKKRSVPRKKRLAIRQKKQKVDQARHNLMHAETAFAAEEFT